MKLPHTPQWGTLQCFHQTSVLRKNPRNFHLVHCFHDTSELESESDLPGKQYRMTVKLGGKVGNPFPQGLLVTAKVASKWSRSIPQETSAGQAECSHCKHYSVIQAWVFTVIPFFLEQLGFWQCNFSLHRILYHVLSWYHVSSRTWSHTSGSIFLNGYFNSS